jgi:flavin-dependent dehydrogenase
VSAIGPKAAWIDQQEIETRWIVAADGQNSRIRQRAGLSRGLQRSFRIGLRRHFRVECWTDFVEVYWGDSGQAYVTPVSPDEICVAVISRNRHVDFDELIQECPQLARRLRHAQPVDSVRGSVTATLDLRSVIASNVALIGEASGCIDAVTGEGMTLAFRQAVQLGKAIASGDLHAYAAAHRKIGRLPKLLGRAMLLMDRSATFRRRALKALSSEPGVFDRLLAVHLGEESPFQFGISGIAALGWQLLIAN